MSTGRVTVFVTGVLLLAGLAAPAMGAGAKPVFERITVDESFDDEELSEACGVRGDEHGPRPRHAADVPRAAPASPR